MDFFRAGSGISPHWLRHMIILVTGTIAFMLVALLIASHMKHPSMASPNSSNEAERPGILMGILFLVIFVVLLVGFLSNFWS